ncbi:protein HEXIM1 [Euwallacea fornicatus]|uniref:protein HEXIM1 n=1 Tax=Euwallacea fornicatus TaxID=995702 RepID=UPI0033906DD0
MSEKGEVVNGENAVSKPDDAAADPQNDVLPRSEARAVNGSAESKMAEAPPKKRKTRRGKSKRKAPYQKYGGKSRKVMKPRIVKPEAPHNDNQFLFEDHGGFEELDERLKNIDQASTSSVVTQTRDSSFSIDSDGEEFYSSPDDEDEFLMQDFNDQYQSIQTEQLHKMSKQELINEYLALDNRNSLKNRDLEDTIARLQKELDKYCSEKEALQKEIEALKVKLETKQKSNCDSEDSETDSSDSCSSSSSVSSSESSGAGSLVGDGESVVEVSYMNGHVSPPMNVDTPVFVCSD